MAYRSLQLASCASGLEPRTFGYHSWHMLHPSTLARDSCYEVPVQHSKCTSLNYVNEGVRLGLKGIILPSSDTIGEAYTIYLYFYSIIYVNITYYYIYPICIGNVT